MLIHERDGLYEVRSNISDARMLFVLIENQMVLLHGFIKKTQKTPSRDLNLAIKRMKEVRQNG